jgi:hypothetical protein
MQLQIAYTMIIIVWVGWIRYDISDRILTFRTADILITLTYTCSPQPVLHAQHFVVCNIHVRLRIDIPSVSVATGTRLRENTVLLPLSCDLLYVTPSQKYHTHIFEFRIAYVISGLCSKRYYVSPSFQFLYVCRFILVDYVRLKR